MFISPFLKTTGLILILSVAVISGAIASENEGDDEVLVVDQPKPGSQKSVNEIAREMTNPLAPFYSFGYRMDYRTYQGSIDGADDQTNMTHILQSVVPFAQKNGKGFVFRFTLPFNTEPIVYRSDRGYGQWRIRLEDPTLNGEGNWLDQHSHSDDSSFDLVYGGVRDSGLVLMYGLAGILPTSSDTSNARQQLIMGPELNIGKITGWGVYGAVIKHVIDVFEKKDKGTPDTTMTTIEAYFSYALGNGWQLFSSPTIQYDWEADSDNKLNLPLGGGFAKTTRIGKMPLRIAAEIQNYVVSTDRLGPDWLFKFTITPVIPSKFTRH